MRKVEIHKLEVNKKRDACPSKMLPRLPQTTSLQAVGQIDELRNTLLSLRVLCCAASVIVVPFASVISGGMHLTQHPSIDFPVFDQSFPAPGILTCEVFGVVTVSRV